MTTLTIRVANSVHGPLLPAEALSLLFGVAIDEIRAHMELSAKGLTSMPPDWVRSGRRRAREAQAHNGYDDMVSVMQYWARKDFDADLVIENFDPSSAGGADECR